MDADEEVNTCPVEWKSSSVLCRSHRCDLLEGHTGPHICNCGLRRRRMYRDEPSDDFYKKREATCR